MGAASASEIHLAECLSASCAGPLLLLAPQGCWGPSLARRLRSSDQDMDFGDLCGGFELLAVFVRTAAIS